MEENILVLSKSLDSSTHKPERGDGKAHLTVRLASDMDEAFLKRLNKVCSSILTENPASRVSK